MRLHVYLGRNRRRARRSFAVRLRHLITDRHCARDGRARPAPIGEEGERRLGAHFHLPHHVGKNFDGRTGARLTAETEHRDNRDADQDEDEEKSAEHKSYSSWMMVT